jgi:Bacterial Ig-like domain
VLALSIDNGLQLKPSGKGAKTHADFIEVHDEDVAAAELQTVLAWAQPLVQQNDPRTNDPPNVIMTIAPGEFGLPKLQFVMVNVTFSEPVTHFRLLSLQSTNGTVSDFSGHGKTYSFVLTPNESFILATVVIPHGVVRDSSNHPNSAAPPFSFESDFFSTGTS